MSGKSPPLVRSELSRDLGLFSITMVGVGAMIGAGIFVLTGIAAGLAGPALILSFCLNGIVTFFTAMVYAELGSAIPEAGGGYMWVKEGLPGGNAFMAGWMSWFAHAVVGSVYALGFGAYTNWILEIYGISFFGLPGEITIKVLAVFIGVAFVAINFKGVSETGMVGNIVSVGKIVILAFFIATGIVAIIKNPSNLQEFHPFAPNGIGKVVIAMGLTFIAFEGYEIIAQAGEEVKNPRKNIPKAIFLSLAIVIPIYILTAFVAIGAVVQSEFSTNWEWLGDHAEVGLAEAARSFMPFGTILLLIGGLFSTMSALNATTYSSTRVSFAMGRDRNLPDMFSKIHPRTKTPYIALLWSGAFIIFVSVSMPIETVATAADIMFLLLFMQVNLAAITIRKKYGSKLKYGFITPFFPVLPIIVIVVKFAIATYLVFYQPIAWAVTGGWLVVGFVIYLVYASKREKEKSVTPVAHVERTGFSKDDYLVLVPIAHKLDIERLENVATPAAKMKNGKVIVLHVITLPSQLPLNEGFAYVKERETIINQAMDLFKSKGLEVEGVIRIARDPSLAIINTIEERNVDLTIMGWHGRSRYHDTVVGSTIDEVIKKANSNVVIIELRQDRPYRKILAPISHIKGSELILENAVNLAIDVEGTKIDVVHVFEPGENQRQRMKFITELKNRIRKVMKDTGYRDIRLLTDISNQPYEDLIDMSYDYDIMLLGSGEETLFSRKIHEARIRYIAQETDTPLMLTRRKASRVRFSMQNFFQYFRELEDVIPGSRRKLK